MVSFVIGTGNNKVGDLSNIEWHDDAYFLRTELDPNGGSSFIQMSTEELLTVPYAKHANVSSETLQTFSMISDADGDTKVTVAEPGETIRMYLQDSLAFELDDEGIFIGDGTFPLMRLSSTNVHIGKNATEFPSSDINNVFIGSEVMSNPDGVTDNIAIGDSAMFSGKSATHNIAIGNSSLAGGQMVNNNVAIGNQNHDHGC